MAGSKWNRPLTDDQRENLQALLDHLDLEEDSLDRPERADRVPVTVHVTTEVAAFLQLLSGRYGLRGKTELARLAILGFAKNGPHPGRDKRPSVYR